MSYTKTLLKACVLLLTPSIMNLCFACDGKNPIDGERLGGIGSQVINATQDDYNILFNRLYGNFPPTEVLTTEKKKTVLSEFSEFFTQYPNEIKEDSSFKYINWKLSTHILTDISKDPIWNSLFFQFITIKEQNLSNDNIINTLLQKEQSPAIYIPPHSRKRVRGKQQLLREQPSLATPRDTTPDLEIPNISNLREYITRDVIGQNEAITSITMDIFDHFIALRRNKYIQENPDEASAKRWVTIPKKNMLVIGESGSGKTKTFEVIDQYFKENNIGIKMAKLNTSGLVSSGYRGGYNPTHIGDIILDAVLTVSKKNIKALTPVDIENAQKRIIVLLDEFDKIRITGNDDSGITNSKVQNELLPYFDEYGKTIEVEREIEPHVKRTFIVNTKDVLFIGMGAFAGLTSIREEEQIITTAEIIQYGFLPEIVGRLPILTTYKPHTTDSLKRILKESRNSEIAQALTLLSDPFYNVTLNFNDNAYEAIARKAIKSKTGARALIPIVQGIIRHIKANKEQYQGTTLTITEEMVKKYGPKDPPRPYNPLCV